MNLPVSLGKFCAIALCSWAVSVTDSSAESTQHQLPGKVFVANVAGKVEAIGPAGKSPRTLKNKDTISERNTVNVGEASKTTLVFSNGSTISLVENSSLVISQFLQNPFSVPFPVAVETAEPTTSTTKLNLVSGEVICKVKKLNTAEGSSLTINTPVGAAGVRGTTFAVSYLPNQNGSDRGTFTLSVTEGVVSFTDSKGKVTLIPAGQEITVSFRSVVDPATGETTILEILGEDLRAIPADRLNRINQVAAEGDVESEIVVFDSTEADPLDFLQGPNEGPGDGIQNQGQNPNTLNVEEAVRALQDLGVIDPEPVTDPNP